jgi:hypothetical protein
MGVIGCPLSRALRVLTTADTSPRSDASKTGRSAVWKLRSIVTSRSVTVGCSHSRFSRWTNSASTSVSSVLSSVAADSAYRMKST